MPSEITGKQDEGRTSIGVSCITKEALNSIKHPGQSYDGLIQELVEFWKRQQRVTESRAVEAISR